MDTIVLTGKKELDIYINPQRQNILRLYANSRRTHDRKADRRPNRHLRFLRRTTISAC